MRAATRLAGVWAATAMAALPAVVNAQGQVQATNAAVVTVPATQTGLRPAPGVFRGGNEGYFPPDAFSSNTNLQEQLAAWYSKYLQAMGEPSLLKVARTESNAVFRFLWLRSFHEPVTVRLKVLGDGSGDLHGVMLDGSGGYDPGKIKKTVDARIGTNEVQNFLKKIELAEFWSRPVIDPMRGCWCWDAEGQVWRLLPNAGLDGAEWVMEGAASNRYNVVRRWTPRNGALREAALGLITMSGLQVGKVY